MMGFIEQQKARGVDPEKLADEFEVIALELDGCLCRYLPEDLSAEFVDAVMRVRARMPEATTSGVFTAALYFGLKIAGTDAGMDLIFGDAAKVAQPAKTKRTRKAIRGV